MPIDYDNEILLVTAAGGKQAKELLKHVSPKWKNLRLNVSTQASADRLKQAYPKAKIYTCDVSDPHACKTLLKNVSACFMVTPGFHPHETECGYNLIDAALANVRSGGPFKHMLHSSVLHSLLRGMVNHDGKKLIEEYLVESGLPYTIVQPSHMMETVSVPALMEQEKPVMKRFWNPETKFSFTTARDLGEAAANILEQREKHFYATYQLVSTPEPISYVQVAKIISGEIGKEAEIERKTLEEGLEMMLPVVTGMKAEEASWISRQGLGRMILHYDDRGLIGNSNVMETLLERKPTDYRQWVQICVQEARQ